MNERLARRRAIEFGAALFLIALAGLVILPALGYSREAARRASCQSNLKQFGIVFKMYAGENRGAWPPLSTVPNNWLPDVRALWPEYLSDFNILMCPDSPFASPDVFASRLGAKDQAKPECVSSLFYTYTGYAIWCDEQALSLFHARRDWATLVTAAMIDLDVPVWPDSDRVSGGSQSTTPVLWDRVPLSDAEFSHARGVNVLHMDGHVEFVPYSQYNNSNFFPATRSTAETFGSVLPQLPVHCYAS